MSFILGITWISSKLKPRMRRASVTFGSMAILHLARLFLKDGSSSGEALIKYKLIQYFCCCWVFCFTVFFVLVLSLFDFFVVAFLGFFSTLFNCILYLILRKWVLDDYIWFKMDLRWFCFFGWSCLHMISPRLLT